MRNYNLTMMLVLAVTLVFPTVVIAKQQSGLDWSKFDFVPGDEIIFEDNQQGERNGEFPSKWDLANGTVENAVLDGENVIMFIKTNTNSDGGIVPMMVKGYEDYLPDEFTVEFDAYFDSPNRSYRVLFYDGKNQRQLNRSANPGSSNREDRVIITQNSVRFGNTTNHYPGFGLSSSDDAAKSKPGWRRVSISFNKRALKVYLDDARVLNIPNMNYNPLGLTFAYHNPTGDHVGYTKNVRVAKGAVPLYDKMLTDGKIVTTGIRFDVNKATLRPESYGVINEIVKLMKENPDLNFSVEGHTDSDGSENSNQTLSEARAKAVMDEMIKMGISPSRLTSVGHGQLVPVAGNDTPEGKAQNRRVEFVKIDGGMITPTIHSEPTKSEPIKTEPTGTGLQSYIMKVKGTIDQGDIVYNINATVWHDVVAEKMASEINYLVVNSRGESFPSKFMEIIDGDLKYDINFQESSARKKAKSKSDIEAFENVKSPDEYEFRQLIEGRGGKFLGKESISGYNCLIFVEGSGENEKKTWYYKGIPIKVLAHLTVAEVTELNENVSIPAERFQIPEGITLK